MTNLAPELIYRRNLPHIRPSGGTFFITFRLVGSIPPAVLADLHAEAVRRRAECERLPDFPERAERLYREQRRFFGKWDAALDAGIGPDWLCNPEVAGLISEAIRHFDRQRYDLSAYCIMPNHVHVVLRPLLKTESDCYPLAQIMHTMKGYTAGQANRLLGRTGAFWQHESYDHFARDEAELERIVMYVLNNPVKSGLVTDWQAWPWTYVAQSAGLRPDNPED